MEFLNSVHCLEEQTKNLFDSKAFSVYFIREYIILTSQVHVVKKSHVIPTISLI